jgi:hypothetical protein
MFPIFQGNLDGMLRGRFVLLLGTSFAEGPGWQSTKEPFRHNFPRNQVLLPTCFLADVVKAVSADCAVQTIPPSQVKKEL